MEKETRCQSIEVDTHQIACQKLVEDYGSYTKDQVMRKDRDVTNSSGIGALFTGTGIRS